MTELQGFVRDVLDLATIRLVRGSGSLGPYQAQLISAASLGRMIDRGNPHLANIRLDAARLGIAQLGSRLQAKNPHYAEDARALKELVELRNALVHDDQDKLLVLSRSDLRPTVGYTTASLTVLNRHARALDWVVWDHLACSRPMIHGVHDDADPEARRSVVVPWGLGDVPGTVLSLFGPDEKQFARVEVELPNDDDELLLEAVLLPVDLLGPAHAA